MVWFTVFDTTILTSWVCVAWWRLQQADKMDAAAKIAPNLSTIFEIKNQNLLSRSSQYYTAILCWSLHKKPWHNRAGSVERIKLYKGGVWFGCMLPYYSDPSMGYYPEIKYC